MKTKMIVWLIVLVFFFSVNRINAQKIYLSTGGNDLNSGTQDKPVASLNAALLLAEEYRKDNPGTKITEIIALAGKYNMLKPLVITPADNGADTSSLLIIKSEQGRRTTKIC